MMALAAFDMAAQVHEGDGYAINLDRMWRAVGCPFGRDPKTWAAIAEPYIRGVEGYYRNLDWISGIEDVGPPDVVIGTITEQGQAEGFPAGSMFGTQFIAYAYAAYLDGTDAC